MTAVSTLIRKVQSDPRYPRYLQALLDGGISMETAVRAAAVRIESEDKEDRKWEKHQKFFENHKATRDHRGKGGFGMAPPNRDAFRPDDAHRVYRVRMGAKGA